MFKASQLKTYHGFSTKLGKLLSRSNEETLSTICDLIFAELRNKPTLPITKKILESCINNTEVSEDELMKAKLFVLNKMEEGEDTSQFERDDAIIEVCWGFVKRKTILKKADAMIYSVGWFENQERNEILNHALKDTLGWHSDQDKDVTPKKK